MQQARNTLDYDFTKIGDSQFLLPLRSEMRMRSDKLLTRNDTEFRMYRKFSAEASVKFETETPAPLPEKRPRNSRRSSGEPISSGRPTLPPLRLYSSRPQEPITLKPFLLRMSAARAALLPRVQAVMISLSRGTSPRRLSSCREGDVHIALDAAELADFGGLPDIQEEEVLALFEQLAQLLRA